MKGPPALVPWGLLLPWGQVWAKPLGERATVYGFLGPEVPRFRSLGGPQIPSLYLNQPEPTLLYGSSQFYNIGWHISNLQKCGFWLVKVVLDFRSLVPSTQFLRSLVPSTQYPRSLLPITIESRVLGTRNLKYWVLGASGQARLPAKALDLQDAP